MGHGRSDRQEELTLDERARAQSNVVKFSQRRTATRLWCGVAISLFISSLAACSQGPAQAPPRPATLTIGVPEAIAGADFSLQNLASNLSLEGLSQLSSDGRALPKIAEGWRWSADGLQLYVNLRKGVTFHDGSPLTAGVAAEIIRAAIVKPSNRALYTSFGDVTDVRATGELELTFSLSRPSSFLPDDLEFPLEKTDASVGTGAYRIVKRDPREVILQANDSYYQGSPAIRQVVIRPTGALRTSWSSLLRGEVDMVTDVPPDAVEFVSNDDVQVVSFGRRYQYLVAFNMRRPPFDSAAVRKAMNLAVDREAVVRDVLRGQAVPSTGPIWPQYWAYDQLVPSFRYDPQLAVTLLESAGFHERPSTSGPPSRLTFTCLIPANFSVHERIGLMVQKQLYDIGVDMRFEVVPIEDLDARIRAGHFDAFLLELLSGPTLSRAYMFWASPRSLKGLNVFGYENREAERLFGVVRATTNEGAVRSATRGLQQVFLDDPPALFLTWNQRSRAVRRNFQIVQDPVHDPADPVYTIWKWNQTANRLAATH